MKRILLTLALLRFVGAFAQENTEDSSWKKIYRAEATRINDLVNTTLEVNFDFSKSYMYGKEWLTLHPHFYPTDSLTLDAKGMNINEVALFVNGKKTSLQYKYDDSLFLRIKLNKTYKSNESYTVYIDYVSKPDEWKERGSAAISGAKGLYFINPRGDEKGKPTEIWTQGETEHNSVWMPTIDKPNQKTTEQISMTVPDKYVTLSNGLLSGQKKNANGTRTDTWKMDLPHAPYLFFMGVGDYAIVKDSYEGKEVAYYVEKEYAPVARAIFGHTPEMIKFFSDKLGIDYVWPKYDQIVGRDYVSGAMENTTCTLHGESAYQDARQLLDGNSWEEAIAHELFHHWFGDLATCESWSNITMNESFADFSETLWNEYKFGKDKGDETNYKGMQDYLNSGNEDKSLVRFNYADKEDLFDYVSYQKGGRVLNMLRNYTGDDAFFKSLNKYLTENKFKTGEAQQLRLAFESVTGQDLNWFWNEWYYGAGHPVLDISYTYDDAAHQAHMIVMQQQKGQIFKMPVNVDIYNGQNKKRYQVWIQNPVDTFNFTYTQQPDLINFDADKILLCEKTEHKTADNYRAQWKYAPLFLDRHEALEYFAENNMLADLSSGLNDKYAGIRSYVLDKLTENENAFANTSILEAVERLAHTEPDNKTRAKAVLFLASTRNAKYKSLFEQSLNDSSYTIDAAGLAGLTALDFGDGYALSKKYLPNAKGDLADIGKSIIMAAGNADDYELVLQAFDKTPGVEKYSLVPPLCDYLSKLTDTQKIEAGIDKVITFKKTVPESYKNETDPIIRESLNDLAKTKGGDVQTYVNDQLKQP
ncbi:MAG TPA: M1 family metallopeptidase [Parafilimonas sp.]|nr:M1 family metallopeptidase [Parafilimonas sp.]